MCHYHFSPVLAPFFLHSSLRSGGGGGSVTGDYNVIDPALHQRYCSPLNTKTSFKRKFSPVPFKSRARAGKMTNKNRHGGQNRRDRSMTNEQALYVVIFVVMHVLYFLNIAVDIKHLFFE